MFSGPGGPRKLADFVDPPSREEREKEKEEKKRKKKEEKGKKHQLKQSQREEKSAQPEQSRKRSRGLSLNNMLTRTPKLRSEKSLREQLEISSPILDPEYPITYPTTLIPLGQITPTQQSPEFLSSPVSPLLPRSPTSGPHPVDRYSLIRTNSEFGLVEPYFSLGTRARKQNLSDSQAPNAYARLPSAGASQNPSRASSLRRRPAIRRKTVTQRSSSDSASSQRSHHSYGSSPFPPPAGPLPLLPFTPKAARLIDPSSESDLVPLEQLSYRASRSLSISAQEQTQIATHQLSRITEASQEPEYSIPKYVGKLPAVMEIARASLQPPPNAGTKLRAVQQAKETENFVIERAKRSGDEPPPYDFLELIGKGAYGRVFKGRSQVTNNLVAIKIIDTDKTDYEEMSSKNLEETLREINILQQLKDSKARPYVNIIEEARTVHNELWIVSEYASGGSVNTLMKPRMHLPNKGLEEKFIVPIARELALGLKFIHEAGVIHRDLKSNNILILEDGRVQLCDFGVSGALEPDTAKRSTIVGTPHWMAPELKRAWVKELNQHSRVRPNEILYGSEVDIWAYGCTIYEMATGLPPYHTTKPFLLPDAPVLQLEGDHYSDELKDLVAYALQPDPRERPNADMILDHPYFFDSIKMFPTVTLVALVEQYYRWEQAGGSRVSLFNPFGAQAPDPLDPEPEQEEEDWTFSTSDEFDRQHSEAFDPFYEATAVQDFAGANAQPQDEDRFAKLQASLRAEQADRGKRRLDRLFDPNAPAYRLSAFEPDNQRPPSDLVLRDFQPGPPNRETVIDLDFAAPTTVDVPSIDLSEVHTVKANRLNRLMRDMDLEEEEPEEFDMDQTARRATRDWKFPMAEEPAPEQSNRLTMEWKMPGPEKSKRKTMEWRFSMAQADPEPLPSLSRMSRIREPQTSFAMDATDANRRTQEFVFPPRDPEEGVAGSSGFPGLSTSPPRTSDFRPTLRHATTEPIGSFDAYPQIISAPESPVRGSMIDLDAAFVDEARPSTAGSASASSTTGPDQLSGPFDLEDQVQLSQGNNRASYHMKSQSEPNHAIPGLLTPQTSYDEEGYPVVQDPHQIPMHARGVSSASQMQQPRPPQPMTYRQRVQQPAPTYFQGWSHQEAFGHSDRSSPVMSLSPAVSPGEVPTVEDRWHAVSRERASQHRSMRSRRNMSTDDEHSRSDADDTEGYDEYPSGSSARRSRVSVGPAGRPLVDFPIPRGPDPEVLVGVNPDPGALADALLASCQQMDAGLGASMDLLRAMRLEKVEDDGEEDEE